MSFVGLSCQVVLVLGASVVLINTVFSLSTVSDSLPFGLAQNLRMHTVKHELLQLGLLF